MVTIHSSSFVASTAVIIGDVTIGKHCGVFPNAVIRGDENSVTIDDESNVQDCCVIHTDKDHIVRIGKRVSVGHGAIIHGALIEDECLIGINATVLNGAHIKHGSVIGANALVRTGMDIPEHSIVLGVPGKIIKHDETALEMIRSNAQTYMRLAQNHKKGIYTSYHNE